MENSPETLQAPILEPRQGWRDRVKNWLKQNSSIILAIVVIFVLAGGIYAYTHNNQAIELTESELLANIDLTDLTEENNIETGEEDEQQGTGGPIIEILEQEAFTETAQKGDGITHLARRALAKHLERIGGNSELTKEHKIFIEDYMQNKTGNNILQIGETRTFTKNLITEAIQASKQLTQEQLNKIAPFAQNVNL